jgi:transcriptional regulator with XRE-family HTH domain
MSTLVERLHELMRAMKWTQKDLVRITKQSNSVVSQWLGGSSKVIKSIGKLEAALYLERESGYSALWIAKGMGAKMADRPPVYRVEEPKRPALDPDAELLLQMGALLARVPARHRRAFGEALRGWAEEGGAPHYPSMLLPLLQRTPQAANSQ